MSPPGRIAENGGFAPRLGLYYAAFFVGLGVQIPFFPIWLAAKGLDPGFIGLVLAVPMIVRVVAVPVVTREADRRDALRAAIVIGSVATAAGYGALGAMEGALAILAAYALFSLLFSTTMPLVDAYALRGLAASGRAYGPVRLWGSVSFIVGSFGAGALLDKVSAQDLIWLIAAAYAATAICAFALAPIAPSGVHAAQPLKANALMRSPVFLAVIAAASLIQASHALLYGFASIAWERAGLSGASIGGLWALGVIAEIVLFAASGRLPRSIGPTVLLMFGAGGAIVRWTAMAIDPPHVLLPALQSLHALSFAATHLGAIGFLHHAAPPGLAATAQGHYAIFSGVAIAAATAASGLLYGAYGHFGYGVMSLMSAAGAALAVYAHHRRPPAR